jgi:hypothetical protein
MIWKTKMQVGIQTKVQLKIQFASNDSKLVPRNLDPRPPSIVDLKPQIRSSICFKRIQIGF